MLSLSVHGCDISEHNWFLNHAQVTVCFLDRLQNHVGEKKHKNLSPLVTVPLKHVTGEQNVAIILAELENLE